jgi:hypothetical protein
LEADRLVFFTGAFVIWPERNPTAVIHISFGDIKAVEVDTAKNMSTPRVAIGTLLTGSLLGGALLGALAKQTTTVLKVDFKDDTGTDQFVLFKNTFGAPMSIEAFQGKILEARRNFLLTKHEGAPTDVVGPSFKSSADDIASTIEKLAILKDKGVLTEAEFQKKKADLLARM